MGYTHYWRFKKPSDITARQLESLYQLAIRQCNRLIKSYNANLKLIDSKHPYRLSGYSVHSSQYGGINFNGTAELSHECFVLREHFNQNEAFNFCKTAQKPYDIMVTACLLLLKHYLGNAIEISSDGYKHNWTVGWLEIKNRLRLTTIRIPDSIEDKTKFNAS